MRKGESALCTGIHEPSFPWPPRTTTEAPHNKREVETPSCADDLYGRHLHNPHTSRTIFWGRASGSPGEPSMPSLAGHYMRD